MKHTASSINVSLEPELPSTVAELLIQAKAGLTYAQTEQWEPLVEWAAHWHQTLISLFDSQDLRMGRKLDKKTVQQFIELNEQLVESVRNARDSVAEQLKTFNRGRRAVRVYREDNR